MKMIAKAACQRQEACWTRSHSSMDLRGTTWLRWAELRRGWLTGVHQCSRIGENVFFHQFDLCVIKNCRWFNLYVFHAWSWCLFTNLLKLCFAMIPLTTCQWPNSREGKNSWAQREIVTVCFYEIIINVIIRYWVTCDLLKKCVGDKKKNTDKMKQV